MRYGYMLYKNANMGSPDSNNQFTTDRDTDDSRQAETKLIS